ncbi:MAG: hypothetical protein JWO82_323, partial [Akkermansiaceae bacterium]|nr:hypothetical protein [Akkermansiaceae bacterium]
GAKIRDSLRIGKLPQLQNPKMVEWKDFTFSNITLSAPGSPLNAGDMARASKASPEKVKSVQFATEKCLVDLVSREGNKGRTPIEILKEKLSLYPPESVKVIFHEGIKTIAGKPAIEALVTVDQDAVKTEFDEIILVDGDVAWGVTVTGAPRATAADVAIIRKSLSSGG